jgi:Zn-dependent peptidase ImmA (M78 family)/plasmid maintenance system antidote protein VapI
MTGSSETLETKDWFSKPGDTIIRLLNTKGVDPAILAERLGYDVFKKIVSGEMSIDRQSAGVLSGELGGSEEFWLKRQQVFDRDIDRAARSIDDHDADTFLKTAPVPGKAPVGRLSKERRVEEVKRRLVFYDASKPSQLHRRYDRWVSKAKLRTSQTLSSDQASLAMWLRQGEIGAELISTARWNPAALRERLHDIKKLSLRRSPRRFLRDLRRLCAEVGIALVVARTPAGCRASGASKLLSADKALVLLSFRFRSNDHFWFTLFHELGHLLLHSEDVWVDFDLDDSDIQEREANEFASDLIIPPGRRQEFANLPRSRDEIVRFAISLDVAPGVIVGQMQHRGMVDRGAFSYLKRIWTWDEIESAAAAA